MERIGSKSVVSRDYVRIEPWLPHLRSLRLPNQQRGVPDTAVLGYPLSKRPDAPLPFGVAGVQHAPAGADV